MSSLTTTSTAGLILAKLLLVPSNSCLVQDDIENELCLGNYSPENYAYIASVFDALSEAGLIERQIYDGDLRVRGKGPFQARKKWIP